MLGLGSNITSISKVGTSIVTDGLVLKHDYRVAPVQPVSSGAAFFDGTNDFINLESRPGIIGHKSITAWVYMTANQQGTILRFGDVMVEMTTATEVTVWADISHSTGDGDTPTALNNWKHIAATLEVSGDDSIIKVYADGVFIESTTVSDSVPDTSLRTGTIGSYGGARYFSGYICNVGLWSGKVLSQPEIKSIMQKDYAGLSDSEKTDLVSWWNLDDIIIEDDSGSSANPYVVGGASLVYDNHSGGGDALGSNLVTGNDSTFSGTSSNWVVYNTGSATAALSYNSSELIITVDSAVAASSDSAGAKLEITSSLTANKTYKITADIWLGTLTPDPATGIHMHLGSIQRVVPDLTTTRRTYTWYGTTTSTNDLFFFHDDADNNEDGTFFIDNVSVQLVNGNTGKLS